ncbi:MAG: NADH:ubiquinone reductase (Na(+)-transporting) subunit F [Bauldia sp.]|nr:NADH:ubiquinone reductase (Na(+)-transporting) subunit F [Bauldia sp.]
MTEALLGVGLLTAVVLLLSSAVMAARSWLLPGGAVDITVNGARSLSGPAGASLLGVLHDAGIPVPASCGGKGTCGLCRVTLKEDGGMPSPAETARLSRGELRKGLRLACQVRLRKGLAVTVSESLFGVSRWTCAVRSARTLSPLIREVVLALPTDGRLTFRPGAFVTVTAPPYELSFAGMEIGEAHRADWDRLGLWKLRSTNRETVRRAYSIANKPDQADCIVLLVRLALPPPAAAGAPPGVVSSFLFGLAPGDTVEVEGPHGEFMAHEGDREMIFIGGGVGMAPLRAIIFDQLDHHGTSRRISFWYGARSAIDLFYVEEFEALKARHPNFDWTVALSDPQAEDAWTGATGFIHNVVYERHLRDHPAPEDCEYYLCGPPLMVKAVLAMLDELGVDPDAIFFDDFGS